MPTKTLAKPVELELINLMGSLKNDPLNFVLAAYPWGQPGPLADFHGPDVWQRQFLLDVGREVRSRHFNGKDPVLPIREAISSGHGIGKSTLAAWVTDWIMSTRPNSVGTVTANTYPQLETKTWPTILKWTRMLINRHWFEIGISKIAARCAPESWFVTAQTCRKDNSEAFHGQHSAQSTSWYLFDEASAIPDEIWQAAEGGLTDGEPMIFALGNPTRNQGKFHRIMFGSERDRWKQRTIDSRDCRFTNKELISEWISDWGEDSDFVRVRVRGVAPRAGDAQFISNDAIWDAQRRQVTTFQDDPLIAGFDVSGGGEAWNVVAFRRGFDARTIPPLRIPGEFTRGDRGPMLAKLADILGNKRKGHEIAMMFVDSAYGAPYVERLRSMGFSNVQEINFGGKSPDRHMANMRAYMWSKLKEWLNNGAIVTDQTLENDLIGPCADRNRSDQLVLESKQQMVKRGVASPDNADALALTFATYVPPVAPKEDLAERFTQLAGSWMA